MVLVAVLVVLVAVTGLPLVAMMGHSACADCTTMATGGLCLAFLALAVGVLAMASGAAGARGRLRPAQIYVRSLYRPPRLP